MYVGKVTPSRFNGLNGQTKNRGGPNGGAVNPLFSFVQSFKQDTTTKVAKKSHYKLGNFEIFTSQMRGETFLGELWDTPYIFIFKRDEGKKKSSGMHIPLRYCIKFAKIMQEIGSTNPNLVA